MNTDQQYKFDELDIRWGQILKIYPDPTNKKLVFGCSFIGCIPGESVIVTADGSGLFPQVTEGDIVVLSIGLPGGIAIFQTRVLFISDIPTLMIYLDYPKELKFKQMRAASRVLVNQPILIDNLTDSDMFGLTGKIVDISSTGAGIELYDDEMQINDEILVKGKFVIENITKLLSFKAIVRVETQKDDCSFYGVEIKDNDEDTMIPLLGYIYHNMSLNKTLSIQQKIPKAN